MLTIPGYRIQETLYESEQTLVARAQRESDGLLVVLKALKGAYPALEEQDLYTKEYEITRVLAGVVSVVQVHSLLRFQSTLALVLEDFGGQTLESWMKNEGQSLREKVGLALDLVRALQLIHAAKVIHRNINPRNILYNPDSRQLKLIDFGAATCLGRQDAEPNPISVFHHSLLYLSPEQSGRMNRAVDLRTDFYSMGVTLYELFCGLVPFFSEDPLELVHWHIAREPVSLTQINPAIPRPLANIVMKLLAKTPERRYRSLGGVLADLEACQVQLREQGSVTDFAIGTRDQSGELSIPQKLYGRAGEIEQLLDGFERVAAGKKEWMLICGPPGIGKTALVKEVYRPLTQRRGFFISGKFDPLRGDRPYSAFGQAFQQLIQQILGEPPTIVERFREKVLRALGSNAGVVCDVIPGLSVLTGEPGEVEEVGPQEQQNRFQRLFLRFVGEFAQPEHPLVIFLDDLQWADLASLNLCSLLLEAPELSCLYLIGAFRDNEVSPGHPLLLLLANTQKAGAAVLRIALCPLTLQNISQLLSETVNEPTERCEVLSQLVLDKTGGNPFFVNEFVRSLAQRELLCLDPNAGCWVWDLIKIREQAITDNVVDLLAQKLSGLPGEVREVLKVASCMGARFELQLLSRCLEQKPLQTRQSLRIALADGVVLALGKGQRFFELQEPTLSVRDEVTLQFAHDRIRQAVYSLLGEAEQQKIHLAIGRHLRALADAGGDESLFDIVTQLNLARGAIEDQDAQDDLARLNWEAGKKAKSAAALDPAFHYLATGLALLGPQGWTREHEVALGLHEEAAEIAYLLTEHERSWALTEQVLEHAVSDLEKVRAYGVRIASMTAQHRPDEAIRAGLDCLAQLGIRLPEHPGWARLLSELLQTRLALSQRGIERLLDLPKMEGARKLAVVQIMRKLALPAFVSNTPLAALLIFIQVRSIARHGHTPWSASVFGSYGIILCGFLHDIPTGYRIGKLALRLLEQGQTQEPRGRVIFATNAFVFPWKNHLRTTLQPFLDGYQLALESGDHEYAALNLHQYCDHAFFAGQELALLEEKIAAHNQLLVRLRQVIELRWTQGFEQMVQNLQGKSANPCLLVGQCFDETKMYPRWIESKDRIGLLGLHFNKLFLTYLFGEYEQAVEIADRAQDYQESGGGWFCVARFAVFDSLARLATYQKSPTKVRRRILEKVSRNQRRLRKWATHAPMNHLHVWHLVEAERLRALGRTGEAEEQYGKAVNLGWENEYLHEEALALERLGDFYLEQGQLKQSRIYLAEARRAYQHWGAEAKVRQLEARHSLLFASRDNLSTSSVELSKQTLSRRTFSTHRTVGLLDLCSFIKASQSIAGEIEQTQLVDKLMKIAVENAGAERGFLIIQRPEGGLFIEAYLDAKADMSTRFVSIPIEESEDLATRIVHYVGHFQESVVLGDASNEGPYIQDPYVMRKRPKSILCLAIVHQGNLLGELYLENNQVTDAFSPQRVEVLKLLASQAAVSLDNSRLYTRLKESKEFVEQALAQAKESARAKSEFLAKTSHELRTPLNHIINIPEGLLESYVEAPVLQCRMCKATFEQDKDEPPELEAPCPECRAPRALAQERICYYDGDPQEARALLAQIVQSGRHLLKVVNDILDLSQFESGKTILHPAEIPVARILHNALQIVASKAAQRGIEIALPDVSPTYTLVADESRLQQILLNLLDNAIKFSPKGGKIAVEVRPGDDEVIFCVRDQGIGIDRKDLAIVFESFRQVDNGMSRRFGGAGLGLAICKQLVELHGGVIWVESDKGQGSSFFVCLPRIRQVPGGKA